MTNSSVEIQQLREKLALVAACGFTVDVARQIVCRHDVVYHPEVPRRQGPVEKVSAPTWEEFARITIPGAS